MTTQRWRTLKRFLRLPLPHKSTKPVQRVLDEPTVEKTDKTATKDKITTTNKTAATDETATANKKATTTEIVMPQELIDLVVDQLSHRFIDLLNVSLVSTRWRASALRHLFKYMSFPAEEMHLLLDFCKDYPHLLHHVRRLRIYNSMLQVTLDTLKTVMSALSNLQELQLFSIVLICVHEPSPVVFPSVTSLVIEDVRPTRSRLGIPYRLIDFVGIFPSLRDITMDVASPILMALPDTYVSPTLHLRSLHLSVGLQKDAGMVSFARRTVASCTTFQGIDINPVTFQFINSMSQSLEKLTLTVTPPLCQSPVTYPPLVNFPRLRTIILDIRGFDTYLTTALAHLPTNVPELIIQFRQYYELGYNQDFRWEDLEAALNRFSFKKLVICREMDASPFSGVFQPPISTREERQIVQRPLAPETKAILEKNLSSFTKRGILHWETDLVIFSGLLSEWTHYVDCPVYYSSR